MAITISFVIHANTLKMCFYEKRRYYKAVTSKLIGEFNLSHWDKKKSRLKSNVPYSEENNNILNQLLTKY